jgi:hypothetical protein
VAVGATEMHRLFQEVIAAVERKRQTAPLTYEDWDDPELKRLASLLEDYLDDLHALIDRYVKREAASFLGPVTDVERWESRQARGASNVPRFITEAMAHSTRATDAKMSTRSCPNCSYPSPDFRVTCRECGYPHGRA